MATYLKTTELSIDGARTLPREYYTSSDILAAKGTGSSSRRWLCIGREDQISNPGDYVLQAVGMDNVIVLRDKAGGVRGPSTTSAAIAAPGSAKSTRDGSPRPSSAPTTPGPTRSTAG